MKYKQEYLKLKKQLAEETKERQRYESYWHTEKDTTASQEEKISKLEEKLRDLETSKLKVEVDLLRKVVSLHEKQPSAPEVNYVDSRIQNDRWLSANTPNTATSSSTTYI
tara:strand:- start:213 stop:542 length:330 start_codon:yes stop_codon:yes gene_type:complete